MSSEIGVFIVDDSATARRALQLAVEEGTRGLRVVGVASCGAEAMRGIARLNPDVVIMDVVLQAEDGVHLTARIMREMPTPILLMTAMDAKSPALSFRALQAGALDVLPKLPARSHPNYAYEQKRLERTLVSLASTPRLAPLVHTLPMQGARKQHATPQILLIGASTGGPPVVQRLLASLGPDFPLPVALVQHIDESFVQDHARWLADTTGFRVEVCHHACPLSPGVVYVPASGKHLGFRDSNTAAPMRVSVSGAIDALFDAAAHIFGEHAIAAVLSGMGADGSNGMAALHEAGAITIAQDPVSCVVDSMPRSVIQRGLVDYIAAPALLARMIEKLRGATAA